MLFATGVKRSMFFNDIILDIKEMPDVFKAPNSEAVRG